MFSEVLLQTVRNISKMFASIVLELFDDDYDDDVYDDDDD